jgi:uncharacterized protein YndB with AHSA1/START domain
MAMAKQLRARSTSRPPKRVWEVLTDFAAFSDWNSFITQARGTARVASG